MPDTLDSRILTHALATADRPLPKRMNKTRRDFLKFTGAAVGSSWLTLHWPEVMAAGEAAAKARDATAAFEVLTKAEAADLAAMASQIFPSDDLPGATEAGVIYYIDRALATFAAGQKSLIDDGLEVLNVKARAVKPGAQRFADLDFSQQTALLNSIVTTPRVTSTIGHTDTRGFFQAVRFMTLAGMFALPSYGGNRDYAGWQLLGFEHRQAWEPPFGYYDAQYSNQDADDDRS